MEANSKKVNRKRVLIYFICIVFIFSLGFGAGYFVGRTQKEVPDEQNVEKNEETPTKAPEAAEDENEKENSLNELKEKLEKEIAEYDGDWALYVENLGTGENIEINNKKMRSASVIKLFIMGKVYEKIEDGTIKKEDVSQYLKDMITISHNESSNILVSMLGGGEYNGMDEVFAKGLEEVNSFAKGLQCEATEQQRDMKDSRPNPIPEENYTSAKDCGILLSKLYHQKLVSPEADKEMLELLKGQQRRVKIPAGLPAETVCANKTGELGNVENDVAIVFSPGADYVICVMSDELKDTSVARNNIAKLSEMTYNFFNAENAENTENVNEQ